MDELLLDELFRLSRATIKALNYKNKTIIDVNEDMLVEAKELLSKGSKVYTLGVKNSVQINKMFIKRLVDSKKYLWHTIDSMAVGGRAVDMNDLNPITGKIMTGSSSCTAINVLYGINDLGIGTDGGGSVLAPALSLNLYSIMAKGMGLKGLSNRVSTDGISFVPGIGVICHCLETAEAAVNEMADIKSKKGSINNINIAICKKGNITLPDGSDMREKLNLVYDRLNQLGVSVSEEEFPDFTQREISIIRVKELLRKYNVLITYEGPIDLLGMGDSVFGGFGDLASRIQGLGGKYMVKIANMINATAVTLPSSEISSGIVITSREGIDEGLNAIEIAKCLSNLYKLPELYYRYFKDSYKRKQENLIFSI